MIDLHARPFLIFALNEDKFAFNVACVTEIIPVGQITVMPEMPAHLLGIFRFRDRVVPLIDLKARLGLPRAKSHDTNEERIVIVNDDGRWLGLKVDAIHEIVPIEEPQTPALEEDAAHWRDVVAGVWHSRDTSVLLLKYTAIMDPAQTIRLAGWQETILNERKTVQRTEFEG